jgi:AcrR family transcriptional regulator
VDTRTAILAVARTRFGKAGLDGLSLRDIAAKVGITPMAIYRHYENKQALIDALVLDALAEWSAIVAAIPPGEPLAWLSRIGEAHLNFALKHPRRYEAAFLLRSKKARRYPDDFIAGQSPAGKLQLDLLEQLVAEGRLAPSAPVEILISTAALSQGLVTLYFAGRIAGGEAEFRALYLTATQRNMQAFLTETRS